MFPFFHLSGELVLPRVEDFPIGQRCPSQSMSNGTLRRESLLTLSASSKAFLSEFRVAILEPVALD